MSVQLLVLHTSEGATTLYSLGGFFAQESAQVSSHVGIDDVTEGTIGEYVKRTDKAWTSSGANPVACQAELCTPSGAAMGWSVDDWHEHECMLVNAAAWLAEEAAALDIPLTKLSAAEAQGGATGVCQHVDLGAWGGGHYDCGPNFPIDYVLNLARGIASGGGAVPPAPVPPQVAASPPFPYPDCDYLGTPRADPHCHSGYQGGIDAQHVRTWQDRMLARGWAIDVDGLYGAMSEATCRDFQDFSGLAVDGLVGPQTWAATWEH